MENLKPDIQEINDLGGEVREMIHDFLDGSVSYLRPVVMNRISKAVGQCFRAQLMMLRDNDFIEDVEE